MLIKHKKEMTEAERIAAENSNNQYLQQVASAALAGHSIHKNTEFIFFGGDAENASSIAILVDQNLSSESDNPVSNKAVSNAIFYATPQMYGAVGDGISDDTKAINDCLHSNSYVFIPKGFYRISYPLNLYARDNVTVKCDNQAIFIAAQDFKNIFYDTSGTQYVHHETEYSMLLISHYVGYSQFACNWEGGIFCCSGVENLRGIKCNRFSQFVTLKNITIVDIGHNGIGIDISDTEGNSISGKHHLDNIRIFGQTFKLGGVLPHSGQSYDINGNILVDESTYATYIKRDNIGLKVNNCFDFEIGTLYVMSCRIGIEANQSEQINVHYYHYWLGADNTHLIDYDDYIKSRAFVGDAYWHFDMFYPDKPYIAFEGRMISCDNTHYICPFATSINNPDNKELACYLGKLTSEYGSVRFGDFDINQSNNRITCRGIITEPIGSTYPYYRNGIQIEPKYFQNYEFLHPSWSINFSKQNITFKYQELSGWTILGYVCADIIGSLNLNLGSPSNLLNAFVNIKNKAGSTVITKAEDLSHNSGIVNHIGLGTKMATNGYNWVPILFKSDYTNNNSTTETFDVFITSEYGSNVPFVISSDFATAYAGEPTKSKIFEAVPMN